MKDEIFGVLQRVGRSFMLPVAILPIAGILLGLGASFTNATTIETYGLTAVLGAGTPLHALLSIMASAGSTIFGNLPIIFAVGLIVTGQEKIPLGNAAQSKAPASRGGRARRGVHRVGASDRRAVQSLKDVLAGSLGEPIGKDVIGDEDS